MGTTQTKPRDFQNHSCHRDDRGIITHCDFFVDGVRYISFPGDFPDDWVHGRDLLYVVSQYDGADPTKEKGETRITMYGKPADAYATDPVEKFVIDGTGTIVEYEVVNGHAGNLAYWGVGAGDRATIIADNGW
jgi:hypothetical protein